MFMSGDEMSPPSRALGAWVPRVRLCFRYQSWQVQRQFLIPYAELSVWGHMSIRASLVTNRRNVTQCARAFYVVCSLAAFRWCLSSRKSHHRRKEATRTADNQISTLYFVCLRNVHLCSSPLTRSLASLSWTISTWRTTAPHQFQFRLWRYVVHIKRASSGCHLHHLQLKSVH